MNDKVGINARENLKAKVKVTNPKDQKSISTFNDNLNKTRSKLIFHNEVKDIDIDIKLKPIVNVKEVMLSSKEESDDEFLCQNLRLSIYNN